MPNWDEGTWDSGSWDSPSTSPFLPQSKRHINRRIMAANPTPDDDDVLKALAEDMADGGDLHEVAIGIKQNTAAVIRAAITAVDAMKFARGQAETLLGTKIAAHQSADEAGTAVLKNCRLRLVKLFGGQFNSQWMTAGWPSGTTAIPTTQDGRFSLLSSLKTYFTAVPASESVDMEATAAICAAAHTAISDARTQMNNAETALTGAKANEASAVRTLRKRVRGLIMELGTLLPDDDARYTDFGLNVPANPVAPETIASLTATATGGGKIHLVWPYSTRLAGTRLQKKVIGVDDDFVSAGTADGLEKTLSGFTPGQTVEFRVIAYNDGGDAAPSPVASAVVT
ncbi:MAG: fibronectin type III domain-containing protein [Verrucomicrobiaceae bacterium]|nr:fibronectin type III domain-containing protein [Verrucomicrobiaceae bacterium]